MVSASMRSPMPSRLSHVRTCVNLVKIVRAHSQGALKMEPSYFFVRSVSFTRKQILQISFRDKFLG